MEKCASRAACVHTCFQRCFEFQPSIIANLCGGFVFSASPSMCALPLDSRLKMFVDDGFESHGGNFCREFFGFGAKIHLFLEEKSRRLPFSNCIGWLVGRWLVDCDLVLTFRHVCHPKNLAVPLWTQLQNNFLCLKNPFSQSHAFQTIIQCLKCGAGAHTVRAACAASRRARVCQGVN